MAELSDDIEWSVDRDVCKWELEHNEPCHLVAHLLINDEIFYGYGDRLYVNCNDQFGPGSDAEEVTLDEIPNLYRMWRSGSNYGALAWCVAKRKQLPWAHGGRIDRMRSYGWDLDALVRGELPWYCQKQE